MAYCWRRVEHVVFEVEERGLEQWMANAGITNPA